MMKTVNNTIDQRLKRVGIHISVALLLLALLYIYHSYLQNNHNKAYPPVSIEDMHQAQEMIDYHRSQGREIKPFDHETEAFNKFKEHP